MPPGLSYLIANEAAERFSFYGMRAILVVFMTDYLMSHDGSLATMGDAEARSYFHLFTSAVYFLPAIGALIADVFWGKYKTIITLSLVYCLGHGVLALDHTRMGLALGLTLIAIGSGGIKPCVSAHLGDQFGAMNRPLMGKAFGWFYFAINFGAFLSTIITPWLLNHYGPHAAFGAPGFLMLLATFFFWVGRLEYAHIPPSGMDVVQELFSHNGIRTILKLSGVYLFVAFFWALYDQTGSAWVLQAKHMDRHWMGIEWLPSQIQAINPILIMLFIPLFSYVIYPAIHRIFSLTALRKISIGFFVTVLAFALSAEIERHISAGAHPNIGWQLLAFAIITGAEVMVSITCLEFSYTQAPKTLKSFVMALFLLSVSLGNAFTSLVNYWIQNDDGTTWLSGPDYYWFFALIMLIVAIIFLFVAHAYQDKTPLPQANTIP